MTRETKIKAFKICLKIVQKLLIIVIKLLLLSLYWFFRIVSLLTHQGERGLCFLCLRSGVFLVANPEPNEALNEAKFTTEELEIMARKIQGKDLTLVEIQEMFRVSYRQANRIKNQLNILEDAPVIRQMNAV